MHIARVLGIAAILLGGVDWEEAAGETSQIPFRIPFRTFFYDAKLDTGQAEIPSKVEVAFVDSSGGNHRLTWRPGFDVRVVTKRKRLGLPPFKARAWQVTGLAVALAVDLDGKPLTSFQFQIKRGDRVEIPVKDTGFVERAIPGGDYLGPAVSILRPRLVFRGNEETLESAFIAEVQVAGKGTERGP